eukprot:1664149-Prymnesium_polylepis.1
MQFVLESRVIHRLTRLHGASEAPPPPCAAASAMHHQAASADRAADIATITWPHGPRRALGFSNTRRKTRIPPSDS